MQALEDQFDSIKNYQVAVKESTSGNGDGLVFLHKVVPGGASHSHGVAVAGLAGVPENVTKRAYEVLKKMEERAVQSGNVKEVSDVNNKGVSAKNSKLNDSKLREKLSKIDINQLTPLEAMNLLAGLKDELDS